ncbi:MAG TPA: T9SS type A sorting domain-containing protein [bacterium]|nr:T9SS type A sorting domain-containing protein [bacterium]
MKRVVLVLFLTLAVVAAFAAQTPGTKVADNKMDVQTWYGNQPTMIAVNPANGQVGLTYASAMGELTGDDITELHYADVTGGKITMVKNDYGNPCIGLMPDGRHMIFSNTKHIPWFNYGGWGTGATLFEETAVGSAQFDSLYWFDENPIAGPNNVLATVMDISDEGVIHLMLYDGWGDAYLYKSSQDGGFTFSQVVIFAYQRDGFTSIALHPFGDDGDVYGGAVAAGKNGKVGVAITDQANEAFFMESLDHGQTWPDSAGVVYITGNQKITDSGDPDHLRAGLFCDVVYDNANNAHVVFEANYYLDAAQAKARNPYPGFGGSKPYVADKKSAIGHWSATSGYNLAATSLAPAMDLDAQYSMLPGRTRPALATWPNIVNDPATGALYVVYNQYSENWGEWAALDSVTNRFLGYGEIFAVGSTDGGKNWGTPVNLTNTPKFDERHAVADKKVVNGKLQIIYFGDNGPGSEYYKLINGFSNFVTSGVYYWAANLPEIVVEGVTPGTKVADNKMDVQTWYGNQPTMIAVNPANGQVGLTYASAMGELTGDDITELHYADVTGGKITMVKNDYGNPCIGLMPDGRHMIFSNTKHIPWFNYGGWGTGATLFEETAVGSAQFDSLYWFDENPIAGPNNVLATVMDISDEGVIHLMLYDGWGDAYLYKSSQDGGFTFSQVVIFAYQRDGFTSIALHPFGDDGDVYGGAVAAGKNGKVGVAITDQANEAFFMESLDHGQTWPDSAGVVYITGNQKITDSGDPDHLRAGLFCDVVYDNANNAHVVFEANYYLDAAQAKARNPYPGFGGSKPYVADKKSAIGHWSATSGYNLAATSLAPAMDLDAQYSMLPGRTRPALATWPNIVNDPATGALYVVYNQYSENWGEWAALDSVTNRFLGYGEIFAVGSTDGGKNWGTPVNLTNTPKFDERHAVADKKVVNGKLQIIYFGDNGPGSEYYKLINGFSNFVTSGVYYYAMNATLTGVDKRGVAVVESYELGQNYPNPFNPTTTIDFSVPKASQVKLTVYNMLGQKVKTLVDRTMVAGTHTIKWDGLDDNGSAVSSGMYIYRLEGQFGVKSHKMMFLK